MVGVKRGLAFSLSVLATLLVVGAACGGAKSGTTSSTSSATSAAVSSTSTAAPPSTVPSTPSPASTPSATIASGTATASPSTGTAATASPSSALADNPALVAQGKQLFSQFQCSSCHSTTGQVIVGPPLNGVYGSQVQLDNGQTVAADQAYIHESILQPDAKTVNGFPKGVMLSVVGAEMSQIQADNNLDALIAYIESLK